MAPVPAGKNPAHYTTSLAYDDLDRVTSRLPASLGRSSSAQAALGIGLIQHTYDAGDNGVGRLSVVNLGSFGRVAYVYDVYLCDWKLLHAERCVLSSRSKDSEYESALGALRGKDLEEIRVGESERELVIRISGDHVFVLTENLDEYGEEDDLLLLYPRGHAPIGYRSDCGFYVDDP